MKSSDNLANFLELLRYQWRRNPFPILLFLLLSLNLFIAPTVYAASTQDLTRQAAYAIGILCLVILALSVYLFVVIFQPERF